MPPPKAWSIKTSVPRIITHVLHHRTHHRAQISAIIRAVGDTPHATALIVFLRKPTRPT
ncbi:MAG: hypothetical protein J0L94_16550 [Rhodothermia bacterium]|nr:hypothetical protein [Rhodothermia bacterium]